MGAVLRDGNEAAQCRTSRARVRGARSQRIQLYDYIDISAKLHFVKMLPD